MCRLKCLQLFSDQFCHTANTVSLAILYLHTSLKQTIITCFNSLNVQRHHVTAVLLQCKKYILCNQQDSLKTTTYQHNASLNGAMTAYCPHAHALLRCERGGGGGLGTVATLFAFPSRTQRLFGLK